MIEMDVVIKNNLPDQGWEIAYRSFYFPGKSSPADIIDPITHHPPSLTCQDWYDIFNEISFNSAMLQPLVQSPPSFRFHCTLTRQSERRGLARSEKLS